MNTIQPLVPRLPGSKQAHLTLWEPILTAHPYHTIIEPYAGGLWTTMALLQAKNPTVKTVICGEVDPSLRGLYAAWYNPHLRPVIDRLLSKWQQESVTDIWPTLKTLNEASWRRFRFRPEYVAAGVALRWLAFSGKLCHAQRDKRKLNISQSRQQVKYWGSFKLDYPIAPKRFTCYQTATSILWPSHDPVLTVIDPPYAGVMGTPTRRSGVYLGPSYFRHEPHSQETYNMAIHSVETALAHKTTVAIACNYHNPQLDHDYQNLAATHEYVVFQTKVDIPAKLNNGTKPTKIENLYIDTYWVFCRPNDPLIGVLD